MTEDPERPDAEESHGTAVRAHLQAHIERASPDELHALIDDLAEHLARRVGTYAPFIHAAIGGIRQAIDRHAGLPAHDRPRFPQRGLDPPR